MEPATKYVVGIGMSLLNILLSSIGFILQRKSHLMQRELEQRDVQPGPFIRGLWAVGVVIYIAAALPDVIAYTMIPMLVCTCIACFRLVLIAILAHFVLQESVHFREGVGILACSIGTLLCLVFGPTSDQPISATVGEFTHPQVITYLVVAGLLLIVLLILEHTSLCYDSSGRGPVFILPLANGLTYGLEKIFNTEIGFMTPPKHFFDHPLWTVMAIFICLFGLLDLYVNLRGAKRMPVQVYVPMGFASSTVVQYLQAAIVFNELHNLTVEHIWLSGVGAALSLMGAILINPPKMHLLKQRPDTDLDVEFRSQASVSPA